MSYEEALIYYRDQYLSDDAITNLLASNFLTENQRRALTTLLRERHPEKDYEHLAEEARPSSINIEEYLFEIREASFRIQNNLNSIKNMLAFFVVLTIIGMFIAFITVLSSK